MADNMEAVDWVALPHVLDWLAGCLHQPAEGHVAQRVLPSDGLSRAHMHALVGLARQVEKRQEFCSADRRPCSTDVGVVLHVWLFRLCGGASTKLQSPSTKATEASRSVRRKLTKTYDTHVDAVRKAQKRVRAARTAAAAEAATTELEACRAKVRTLRFTANDLMDLLAVEGRSTTAVPPSSSPPPPPHRRR